MVQRAQGGSLAGEGAGQGRQPGTARQYDGRAYLAGALPLRVSTWNVSVQLENTAKILMQLIRKVLHRAEPPRLLMRGEAVPGRGGRLRWGRIGIPARHASPTGVLTSQALSR